MIGMLWLALAISSEVCASLALRATIAGHRGWHLVVAVGYPISLLFLTVALRAGLGIGVAYGLWAATGVALVALLSWLLFGERLSRGRVLGISLIVIGVALVEAGANHA